jgi:hypothetical protein
VTDVITEENVNQSVHATCAPFWRKPLDGSRAVSRCEGGEEHRIGTYTLVPEIAARI